MAGGNPALSSPGWFSVPGITWGAENTEGAVPIPQPDSTGLPLPPPDSFFNAGPAWERTGRSGMAPVISGQPTEVKDHNLDLSGPAWERSGRGGQPAMASAPTSPPANSKYSFLDNPGASDALIAFGANMLKAPDFMTGLGDGALAVNEVARNNRPLSEQEFARAKQLGMLKRLQDGGSAKYTGKEMGYAPIGKDGAMMPVPAFMSSDGMVEYQMPDGTKTTQPPEGWTRATDSTLGNLNKYQSKADAESEQQGYTEAMAATENLVSLERMRAVGATAGVGLDAKTRVMRELVKLTGAPWESIDPSSVSTLDASARQLALDWSQKMKGQGQVTEFERKQITEMLPAALSDPKAFNNLIDLLSTVERRKQQLWLSWSKDPTLRNQYGSYRAYALNYMTKLNEQGGVPAPPAPAPAATGAKKSLTDIFGN